MQEWKGRGQKLVAGWRAGCVLCLSLLGYSCTYVLDIDEVIVIVIVTGGDGVKVMLW